MRLTAVAIKAAKGGAKPCKLTDSDGLHLPVLPSAFVHPVASAALKLLPLVFVRPRKLRYA